MGERRLKRCDVIAPLALDGSVHEKTWAYKHSRQNYRFEKFTFGQEAIVHPWFFSDFDFHSTLQYCQDRSMCRGMTTPPLLTVSDTIVAMGLSRNRENGARRITQWGSMNSDL